LTSTDIVRVALPLPLDQLFSYTVPPELVEQAVPGRCVTVPFGRQQLTGVIVEPGEAGDLEGVRARAVKAVSTGLVEVTPELLELTRWMATYYMCSWGEALRAALPPGTVSASESRPATLQETRVALREDAPREEPRGERQQTLLQELRRREGRGMPHPTQPELLAVAGGASSTVQRLVELGYVRRYETRVDRLQSHMEDGYALPDVPSVAPELHPWQAEACQALDAHLETGTYGTFLLHGVTGSGKTEVYLAALEKARAMGKSAIVLVPEIALTPQTVRRFRARFGNRIALLHSRMSAGERFDAWRGIREGHYPIVIGPRSAILAPVQDLGIVIVDEEHESTYKQFDPAPRYHARDVAVVRARAAGAVCVLGSATPSLESLANAREGRYTLLTMPDRVPVGGRPAALPDIRIVDLRGESALLSPQLVAAIEERKKRGEQAIILLNRRGYAPSLECQACGWTPECPDCSVSMVFHKPLNHLRCHYCGVTERMPSVCPSCASDRLEKLGTGTQRLEERLREEAPDVRVLRMDLDTTTTKNSHNRILEAFGRGDADVLLGTQMVAKGLDFPKVTLVGIVQADAGLALPDIRAEERTFQLLTQVAGRAGRADLVGEVLLQTRQPGHTVIQHAIRHDYEGFAKHALAEREALGYPPTGRMISALFSGVDDHRTESMARLWARRVEQTVSVAQVLGPAPAFIHRVKKSFRHQVVVKLPGRYQARGLRDALEQATEALGTLPNGYRVNIDVDPMGLV
jgi:primosomal protein N' (replication factor Y)